MLPSLPVVMYAAPDWASVYNAEAVKSQTQPSVYAVYGSIMPELLAVPQDQTQPPAVTVKPSPGLPPFTGVAAAVQFAIEQFQDRPTVTIRPAVATPPTAAPIIFPYVALPQTDITQPPAITAPVPVTQGILGSYTVTLEQFQDRPTVLSWASVPVPPRGILGSFQVTAEQFQERASQNRYPTVPTPPSISLVVMPSEYIFGTHAVAIYNAEAAKSHIWPSVPTPPLNLGLGIICGGYTFGTHQADIYNAEAIKGTRIFPTIQKGGVITISIKQDYRFGSHAETLYNAEAIKSQTWPSVAAPQGFLILQHFEEPQIEFTFTPQASFSAPLIGTHPNTGKILGTIFAGPQQVDLTIAAQTWSPMTTPPPPAPTVTPYTAGPQQVDLTLQAVFNYPIVPAPMGPILPTAWYFASPEPYDYTVRSYEFSAAITQPPHVCCEPSTSNAEGGPITTSGSVSGPMVTSDIVSGPMTTSNTVSGKLKEKC